MRDTHNPTINNIGEYIYMYIWSLLELEGLGIIVKLIYMQGPFTLGLGRKALNIILILINNAIKMTSISLCIFLLGLLILNVAEKQTHTVLFHVDLFSFSRAHLDSLIDYCQKGVEQGAKLVYGGKRADMPGRWSIKIILLMPPPNRFSAYLHTSMTLFHKNSVKRITYVLIV